MITNSSEDYLSSVVVPYYKNSYLSNDSWAVRNKNHEFVAFSDKFAEQIKERPGQLIGKSLRELGAVNSEFSETERELDNMVWQNPDGVYSQIELLKFSDECPIPLMVYRSAIKYEEEIVAVEAKYFSIDESQLNLSEYVKMDSGVIKGKKPFNQQILSNREKMIIYLLILRKTQHEIAALCNVSRCRVAQIIADICQKCSIPGVSAKVLVDYAKSLKMHKQIPLEILALMTL